MPNHSNSNHPNKFPPQIGNSQYTSSGVSHSGSRYGSSRDNSADSNSSQSPQSFDASKRRHGRGNSREAPPPYFNPQQPSLDTNPILPDGLTNYLSKALSLSNNVLAAKTSRTNSTYSGEFTEHHLENTSSDSGCKSKPSTDFYTNSSQYSLCDDLGPVIQYAKRPNFGTVGRVIPLKTNFFEIAMSRSPMVYQYHIEISFAGSRRLEKDENRTIFWKAVQENPDIFPKKFGLAYDGNHQLYSVQPIAYKDPSTPSLLAHKRSDNEQLLVVDVCIWKDSRPTISFIVSIVSCGPVLLDLTKDYTALDQHRPVTPIQIIDIIFKQSLTCPFVKQSANFYCWKSSAYRMPINGADALSIGGAKQVWTGFFSAAHVALGYRPLLNVDIDYTVFYKPKVSMLEFLCEILNEKYQTCANYNPRNNCNNRGRSNKNQRNYGDDTFTHQNNYHDQNCFDDVSLMNMMRSGAEAWSVGNLDENTRLIDSELRYLEESVKGLKIRVRSKDGAQRVYRVNGVKGPADRLLFSIDTGTSATTTTVAHYFKQKYGALKYPTLPCLHVGPSHRNTFFPIEVCYLEDHQKYTKKLSEKHTAAIIKAAAVDAQQREGRINALFRDASFENDPFLEQFGLNINPEMVATSGRIIQPPAIQYREQNKSNVKSIVYPKDGAWSMDNQELYLPATCQSYALMALIQRKDEGNLQHFCSCLALRAKAMGMRFPEWPDVVKYGRPTPSDVKNLYREICEFYINSNRDCDMVIIVLPAKNADVYMTIKENSDVVYGVMSQCVLLKNVSRLSQATLANLILKLNLKLGGINAAIIPDEVSSKYLVNQPTLVIGIDVTHPTQAEIKNQVPSVAAVVGNIDMLPQTFAASVMVQRKSRQEVVDLVDAMIKRINHFTKCTGIRPERILVYRDGVSEGQFEDVMRKELVGIRQACSMIDPNYAPPLTYIVVQKRHHARMFCSNVSDAVGKARNIPPGTTIDTGITSSEGFDFYLCSHFGIQGTSRPAHYHVLWDDSKFTSDQIQALSFQLCHNFGRCNRSVSIPTPVYYADLVCTRSRLHVKRALGVLESEYENKDTYPSGSELPHRRQLFRNLAICRSMTNKDGENKELEKFLMQSIKVVASLHNRMYFL
uniref:ArgoN domain-containing protein n=1 Tax=Rhabditophanes sp. KR3021 TaxID=114890 RepID=A0AC35TUF3_9BILA